MNVTECIETLPDSHKIRDNAVLESPYAAGRFLRVVLTAAWHGLETPASCQCNPASPLIPYKETQ